MLSLKEKGFSTTVARAVPLGTVTLLRVVPKSQSSAFHDPHEYISKYKTSLKTGNLHRSVDFGVSLTVPPCTSPHWHLVTIMYDDKQAHLNIFSYQVSQN